jgi:hypothetical protein
MDLTRRRAAGAAARLLAGRQSKFGDLLVPKDMIQLMDLLDQMAKTPRKYGVSLSKVEKRELAIWHLYKRAELARGAQ